MPHSTTLAAPAHDQARSLRELIGRRTAEAAHERGRSVCRSLAVVSGKGGVGKSALALNLAVALARRNKKVCLLDASLGLGSLELMCGLNGYWNLSHLMSGARQLEEITLSGPEGVHLLPGASSLSELSEYPAAVQQVLIRQMQALDHRYDALIIDTGSGLHRLARQFALSADQMLVVTTPEPTAITDAYSTIKSLCGAQRPPFSLIVNQADSPDLARRISDRLQHTTRTFLHADLDCWGGIPRDPAVSQSINARNPLITFSSACPAAQAIEHLTDRWLSNSASGRQYESYFSRLLAGFQRTAS